MLRLSICAGSLILLGTILAEDHIRQDGESLRETARFGFSALDKLRQSFCSSFCTSADTNPYLTNIMCAAKCPELYLPHRSTIPASTSPTTATTSTAKLDTTPLTTISTASSSTASTSSTTSTTTNPTIPPTTTTTMKVPTTTSQSPPMSPNSVSL